MAPDEPETGGLSSAESSPAIEPDESLYAGHAGEEPTAEPVIESLHSSDEDTVDPLTQAPPDGLPLHSTDEPTEDPLLAQSVGAPAGYAEAAAESDLVTPTHAPDEATAEEPAAETAPEPEPEPEPEPVNSAVAFSEPQAEPAPIEDDAVTQEDTEEVAEEEAGEIPEETESTQEPDGIDIPPVSGFKGWIKEAIAILKRDRAAILRNADNPEATKFGIIFLFVGSFIAALVTQEFGKILAGPLGVSTAVLGTWGVCRFMGSKATYIQHFRPTALSTLLYWPLSLLLVIPVAGPWIAVLLSLYLLVIQLILVEDLHGIERPRAFIVLVFLFCCYGGNFWVFFPGSAAESSSIQEMIVPTTDDFVAAPIGTVAEQGAQLREKYENLVTDEDIKAAYKETFTLRKSVTNEGAAMSILWFADAKDTDGGMRSNVVLSISISADAGVYQEEIAARRESDKTISLAELGPSAEGFDLENSRHEVFFEADKLAVAVKFDASQVRRNTKKSVNFKRTAALASTISERITTPPAPEPAMTEEAPDDLAAPMPVTEKTEIVIEDQPVADDGATKKEKSPAPPTEKVYVAPAKKIPPPPHFVKKSNGKEIHDFTYERPGRPGERTGRAGEEDDFTSDPPRLRRD